MKIVFDLTRTQPLKETKFHGGGKYGEIVFIELVRRTDKIACFLNEELYLNPRIRSIIDDKHLIVYNQKSVSIIDAARKEGNVIYTPLLAYKDLGIPDDIQVIGTLHGARAVELPFDKNQYLYAKDLRQKTKIIWKYVTNYDYRKQREFIQRLFSLSNFHVITVSEHSRSVFNCFLDAKKDIPVFYSPSTVDSELSNSVVPYSANKYYLIVSGNRWEKNAYRAVKVFDELFSEHSLFQGDVIVTGADDNSFMAHKVRNKHRFKFVGYVDNSELAALYKGAYLFCYPSLNEGFGYPPLEAMSCGVPVIASAISSIPEVCGDGALYFNPLCQLELKARIIAMEEETTRQLFREKAERRYAIIKARQDRDLNDVVDYILSYIQ